MNPKARRRENKQHGIPEPNFIRLPPAPRQHVDDGGDARECGEDLGVDPSGIGRNVRAVGGVEIVAVDAEEGEGEGEDGEAEEEGGVEDVRGDAGAVRCELLDHFDFVEMDGGDVRSAKVRWKW